MSFEERSYYEATRRVDPQAEGPLSGSVRTDVCVVGGGITGCSAALHLAERGYRVVLLEAERIGWGASGRSGGQVLPGLGTDLGVVAQAIGREGAREVFAMTREAVALTIERVRRHEIPCDLRFGAVHAAIKPRHLRELADLQATLAREYGYDEPEWLDREALRERVRTERYIGGLREPGAVHLHPLNYTLGLARAAVAAGARLHEGTAARRLRPGRPAVVETERGRVEADFVVLAGNAYLGAELAPELRGRLMPVGNYVLATAPLDEAQVAQTLPGGDAVSDANFVLDYYRLSTDRRLLFGGEVSYNGRDPERLQDRLVAKLAGLFPAIAGVPAEYCWGGRVGITLNRAPDFGRIGDSVYYAQGYSGQGMALAGLAGKLLAEAIGGQAERFDRFARVRHRRFPGGERLRTPLLVLATNFYRLRDRL
ncbi:NAD(P)/FAD-dependent oxidoreductase [Spiribacter halobius]|uniref:FAD-dependent oxidoreductase n=1 Tax=Sediminicurvatus halobius TaxID=2182432 RepID=A0A2U2N1K6_9GAMM|nr:FAD-binding oxidoreductase [Spiribacter halobius]PWG63091.1 FAD-dependent oxidoreductase [Spiribacter halobius]UEX77540.1 FAD-binding oxidoreductase [Spiribacter halobius]